MLLEYTLKGIRKLLLCPMTSRIFDNPVILQSGHTIDIDFMERLIANEETDPYNMTLK
jgi:hypothetical protein